MTFWQKIPLIIIMALIDVVITFTVASTSITFLLIAGFEKNLSLGLGIASAVIVMFYIRFNHKLRNQLLSKGDK